MKVDLQHVNTYSNPHAFRKRMQTGSLPSKLGDGISFKGISSLLNKEVTHTFDSSLTKVLDGRFGTMFDNFKNLITNFHFNQTIKVLPDEGKIIFNERTMLGKAFDIVKFFGKNMWLDIASGILGGLKKIKGIANSDIFNKIYNSKILTNRRNASEANDLFYSILGMVNRHQDFLEKGGEALSKATASDKASELDKMYRDFINKGLNKPVGSYPANKERALNRLATGAVSALFVGNDFYNLTMYQTNNKDEAKKSQKKRIKQELTRIVTSAFLSFSVLGLFSKWTNKSLIAAAGATAATTLFSEMVSRIKNGVPLTPLTSKRAKEIHDKRASEKKENKGNNLNVQNDKTNKLTEKNEISNVGSSTSQIDNKSQNPDIKTQMDSTKSADDKKPKEKKSSVFKNLAKILGATVLIGFAWDMITKFGIKNAKKAMANSNSKFLNFMADFKNNVIFKDRKIPKTTMDSILDAVEKGGSKELKELYAENLGNLDKNGCYTIGKVNRKLAIPLRIPEKIMDAIKLPYVGLCKLLHHTPSWVDTSEKTEFQLIKQAIGVLYDEVSRRKNIPEEELRKIVAKRIDSLFNDKTIIKYKQSDLALLNRTFVTTIASYFFINDFRNQVLIDSAGKDTKRAEEVTNERLGHKLTNFITNAFWMNFFNTTFSKTVMGSLLGATTVAAATEVSNESSVRYSIGVPIKKMGSKEDIQEFEAKKYYGKGLYGKWIRFFSKLTGKKPISQKAKNDNKTKKR